MAELTAESLTRVFHKIKTTRERLRSEYWTSDWDEMYKFVVEHNVPEFFSKSLNQSNVKEFLDDNPDIVPKGLNADSEYVLSIYKPTKKGE